MDWQFGDEDIATTATQFSRPPATIRKLSSKNRRPLWLVVFLVALAISWITGFYLGRIQQATTAIESDIQALLDIEAWAWSQADWTLFRSILPHQVPSWQLIELRTEFYETSPGERDIGLISYTVSDDGNQIEAIIQIKEAQQQFEVPRTYQFISGRWRLVGLEKLGKLGRP